METKQKTVCVYHGNCLDGFTAAWVLHSALNPFTDLTLVKGAYTEKLDVDQFIDADVYFVDFSVKAPEMQAIAAVANKVVILDHHASAERELQIVAEKTGNVHIEFDMKRSGAMITWDYFFPSSEAPTLIKIVQDRDLWLFKNQYTKALTAYMFTLEQTIDVWNDLLTDVNSGKAIDMGQVLLDAHDKNVAAIIDGCTREVLLGEHKVNLTNAHWMYASDIGHKTIGDNLFSMSYFINSDGVYSYSLRADNNFDCSVLAETYRGGGHPNAAGFSSVLPVWTEINEEL